MSWPIRECYTFALNNCFAMCGSGRTTTCSAIFSLLHYSNSVKKLKNHCTSSVQLKSTWIQIHCLLDPWIVGLTNPGWPLNVQPWVAGENLEGLNFISVKGIDTSLPFQSIQTIPCVWWDKEESDIVTVESEHCAGADGAASKVNCTWLLLLMP